MLYDFYEVEAIKIAVHNIEAMEMKKKDILIKSIVWLKENYEKSGEILYLKKAVWNMYAYLELGFSYEESANLFDMILSYLSVSKEDMFPRNKWFCKKIKLTKNNIRNLLGSWNPVLHSMKIKDTVNDIYEKVKNREYGNYEYHSGKVVLQNGEKQMWENTFRLYIDGYNIIFHDINKNKYFLFEEETNDKNRHC